MNIIKYCLIFILCGCTAGKDKELLPMNAFSWTEKCSLETNNMLEAASFYDLRPKNIYDIIAWTKLRKNDFFHIEIQKMRREIPEKLNMDDLNHQKILISKFKIRFKGGFSKECENFALPFIRSELERHSAQYFEYNFLDKKSSRKFLIDILYGQ